MDPVENREHDTPHVKNGEHDPPGEDGEHDTPMEENGDVYPPPETIQHFCRPTCVKPQKWVH